MTNWGEIFRYWGTTDAERQRAFPCDAVVPGAEAAYFRAVSVAAPGPLVYRWLCQLRVAPYSYDWIDNGGRRSPPELGSGLDDLEVGQRFMRIFELVDFERDEQVTLQLLRPSLFPPLAVSYVVASAEAHSCRLLVKLALHLKPGLRGRIVDLVAPPLDWIMMRRQLLNLKALAEGG